MPGIDRHYRKKAREKKREGASFFQYSEEPHLNKEKKSRANRKEEKLVDILTIFWRTMWWPRNDHHDGRASSAAT